MPLPKQICSCCGKLLTRQTILAHSRGGGLQINKAQFAQLHSGILPIQSTSQPRPPVTAAEPPRKRRRLAGSHDDLHAPDINFSVTNIGSNLDGSTSQNRDDSDMEYERQTRRRVTVEDVTDEEDSGLCDSDSSDSDSCTPELDDDDEESDWVTAAEWTNTDFEKALDDCGALCHILIL